VERNGRFYCVTPVPYGVFMPTAQSPAWSADPLSPHTVLVAGGGPAGSTAAALLARQGRHVLLLEKDKFPRYHIGESLQPSSRTILELSGAVDAVDDVGFQVKHGGRIVWGSDQWTVDFADLPGPSTVWQVERADFDKVLLDNARKQGAEVIEGAKVTEVHFSGDRAVAADYQLAGDDRRRDVEFDWLIDASGRAGLLSVGHFRSRTKHRIFRNAAIWGYFRDARLPAETPAGGIGLVAFPDGWTWLIPLRDGLMSVGHVVHIDAFRERRRQQPSLRDVFESYSANSPNLRPLLAKAKLHSEIHVEADFSYSADRFAGPGWFLSGDAGCFLDPLLSTGVHLATYSATTAAASLSSLWRGEVSELAAIGYHEVAYRRSYSRFLTMVSSLYSMYQEADKYFWAAQRLSHEKSRYRHGRVAFTDLVTGWTDIREAVNADGRVLTGTLLHAAEAAQQQAIELGSPSTKVIPGLDAGEIAHAYPLDSVADFELTTDPLGIARVKARPAAAPPPN
jgi:flavin-dependent dehydrogenase